MDMDELFSQVDEKRKVSKSLLFMSIEHVRVDKMYFFPHPVIPVMCGTGFHAWTRKRQRSE